MSGSGITWRRWLTGVAVVLGSLVASPAEATAHFQLGLQDPGFGPPANVAGVETAAQALRASHSSVVRIAVYWASVAPDGATMPPGFNPSDPGDPQYRWGEIDAAVRAAAALHARIMLNLLQAPHWAEGPNRPADPSIQPGAWDPQPAQLASFAHAAAERYSGHYPDPLNRRASLPAVSYWEVWNEENLPIYFAAPDPVNAYRTLLNAGYAAIKAVKPRATIVFGGLAPVSYLPPLSAEPLSFAAAVLCLHQVGTRFLANPTCPQRADFDAFAMHPYSLAATPTKHAYDPNNVLVGDVGKVGRLVQTADRLHTDAPQIHHQFFVTEFAWFTNPPDPLVGDSDPVAARYVAYSLYEMWRADVSLVVWQTVLDRPTSDFTGGGLYWGSGQPKLMFRAFAFPVVASLTRGRGFVWGRAPVARAARIVVQRGVGARWRDVAKVRTGPDGVFYVGIRSSHDGLYRARVIGGPSSLAYSSTPIPPERTHEFNTG